MNAAPEAWLPTGTPSRVLVTDEFDQRDRFLRENLDAMARKLGEMQAKMVQIVALGERVTGLAGINTNKIKGLPGRGGTLVSGPSLTLEELQATLADRDRLTDHRATCSPWWSRACLTNRSGE